MNREIKILQQRFSLSLRKKIVILWKYENWRQTQLHLDCFAFITRFSLSLLAPFCCSNIFWLLQIFAYEKHTHELESSHTADMRNWNSHSFGGVDWADILIDQTNVIVLLTWNIPIVPQSSQWCRLVIEVGMQESAGRRWQLWLLLSWLVGCCVVAWCCRRQSQSISKLITADGLTIAAARTVDIGDTAVSWRWR